MIKKLIISAAVRLFCCWFQRDLDLEQRVLQWIVSVVHEKPSTDYETFIQDGSILSRVMVNIVFNSVPLEQIDDNWGMVSDNLDLFCHHEINKQKNNVMKRCL